MMTMCLLWMWDGAYVAMVEMVVAAMIGVSCVRWDDDVYAVFIVVMLL